jgi:MFS family permease
MSEAMSASRDVETMNRRMALPGGAGVASLGSAVLLSSLGTSSVNAALPVLASSFSAPFQQVQWVVLAYLVAMTGTMVGAGRAGDIAGRRRLLVAGMVLFAGASAAAALSTTITGLVVARAVQGMGAAFMASLATALVADVVPRERTGRAMGLMGTMSAVGTAVGPSLGGILVDAFGWPSLFIVNVPLSAAAAALVLRSLPADPPGARGGAGLDPWGSLVLTATLAVYAFGAAGGAGPGGWVPALLVAASVGGTVLFLQIERRVSSPLVQPEMLRSPALASALGANVLVSTVMMATLVVGPFSLSRGLGLAATMVGFVMATGPGVSVIAGIVAGRIVDRVGAGRAVLAGLAVVVAGSIALATAPALLGWPGYVAALVVLTPGYQLFQAANTTAVLKEAAPDSRGVVSALLALSRSLGLITGASVMGLVFRLAAGGGDVAGASPGDVAAAMRVTFLVAALLAGAALAIAWAAGGRRLPGQ